MLLAARLASLYATTPRNMTDLSMGRGAEADYLLGTSEGWGGVEVVRFHATEAMSQLFAYDIVLLRAPARGPLDLDALVDTPATLRIATERRWRPLHGVIADAELLEHTETMMLYRALLVPHLVRAAHRRRCRTFVEKSIEEIVTAVLENRGPDGSAGAGGLAPVTRAPAAPDVEPSFASFVAPHALYRWAIGEPERLRAPRRMIVQYNETDLDFMARLLEAEGVSWFFEHGATELVLTLSDRPGVAPMFPADARFALISSAELGVAAGQEVVRSWRTVRRMRSNAVRMRDYAWRKSLSPIEAVVSSAADAVLEHFEYPAADEDEPARPAEAPARFQLERLEIEHALGEGSGTVRTLEPGRRFLLADRAQLRPDEELTTVAVETYAQQRLPERSLLAEEPFGFHGAAPKHAFFECRFRAAPARSRYRPARETPAPRIHGVQPARVTAEEHGMGAAPELNSDELGRVRVRFPWDQRPADGTASSKWIRVAQFWAGAGFGAMYVPRVGHEVLVAFERGDPDRPIIVGRVYNAQNPPPYVEANTTKSTVKSDSVGADGSAADGFNELRFDDQAGKEQVFLHAQRNLDEIVRACHSTGVGGDQSNGVGGNQSNSVAGNRTHQVNGTELIKVDGPRTTDFGATESHSVVSHRVTGIGANDTLAVGADHSVNVNAHQRTDVGSTREVKVGASQNIKVGTSEIYKVGADRSVKVGGHYTVLTEANYTSTATTHGFKSTSATFDEGASFEVKAGAATLALKSGLVVIDNGAGASITLAGALIVVHSGSVMDATTGVRAATSGGPTVISAGGAMGLSAGGDIDAKASTIKLNG